VIDQRGGIDDHHPTTEVVPKSWQPGGPITLASDKVLDQLENGGTPYENELQSLSYLASLTLDSLTWHSARKDVRAEISDDAWRQILSRVKDKDQFADTLAELYIWGFHLKATR
jgi:hypothetical protein